MYKFECNISPELIRLVWLNKPQANLFKLNKAYK